MDLSSSVDPRDGQIFYVGKGTGAWIGPLGRRVEFTAAAQNPISYWPWT